jgi:hypothetical protein
MSSLTNINNNSSVINVGRTTPVSPGPRPAAESIPVVVASDQSPIPVIEQQKIQSEVALSLLGIPRSEVALGIFSDVNTYDVNPNEWSEFPSEYTEGYGIKHLPQEAGAIVEAPKDKIAILSSKRFFRYQPGRVSSATFGVKSSKSPAANTSSVLDLNPAIRKYGIFDKFDGYYWETRGDTSEDNFVITRRTQSLINLNPVEFSLSGVSQQDDYRIVGKAAADPSPEPNEEPRAIEIIRDKIFDIVEDAYNAALAFFDVGGAGENLVSYNHLSENNNKLKCERDAFFAINAYILDLQYGGIGHTVANATTYRTAISPTSTNANASSWRTAENKLHDEIGTRLKAELSDIANLNGIARNTRINNLVTIIKTAVGNGSTQGVQPSSETRNSTNPAIWPRNKFSTIFAIYKKYLGYIISETFRAEQNNNNYTDAIKYKCLRDVGYIVDGYSRDLAGGGNAATVYNMKNFYFFNNVLQVVTTFASGYSVQQFHIDAHTLLKTLISKDGNIDIGDNPNPSRWNIDRLVEVNFTPVFNYFNLGSARNRFDNELAQPLIDNFTTPYSGRMNFGSQAQFGDLITFRDGLLHIHAAVFDPSLLKETKKVRVRVNTTNNTLEASEGEFVVNQMINYVGDAGGLTSNKFYAVKEVKGPLSNVITLYDPLAANTDVVNITSSGTDSTIEPNVPFIFPKDYQADANEIKPSGMFPLMYTESGNLPPESEDAIVGFIDTSLDTSDPSSLAALRTQIDTVNLKYNNWIKQNVDPRYYAVYEYRIPRSRFSTDKLDGKESKVVYSDVAVGEFAGQTGVKVRPGQNVVSNETIVQRKSVWDIDLTKVTMLKVDFSWYGAVGALFLAYVPVSNDEARWVRVHHLRASNQLKISSLGNATLPITYLTYGGGSQNKLGNPAAAEPGTYGPSEHVVKYGASYYIDGGDRGTVRLYSHTNLLPATARGRTFTVSGSVSVSKESGFPESVENYFTVSANTGPEDKTFFMKSQVVTSSILDQNVQVVWVDGNKLYINKALNSTSGVKLLVQRPAITFGLKAKENIFNSSGFGVRNRVQVYPTKLSTANFANVPMTLDVMKTPIFQPNVETTQGVSFDLDEKYIVSSLNEPLPASSTSFNYLPTDGLEVYGWFIANVGSVFGRLYREGGIYYFQLKDVFTEEVELFANIPFLKDGRFAPDGSTITSEFESISQKERLSSVFISNVNQTPIPGTGSMVTSFFLSPGADQFDLQSYFDYNKDYLSFPLTDEVESIYLAATLSGENSANAGINTSITWEEQ